jgi:formate dehydrogenase alpha subunit
VLELARESGVDIPTLCYDPRLRPYGACRVCLVEDERTGALLASCVAPIASGMVINTVSPRALERRKTIVELMLASHPDSCFVCDKGNRCELRRIASDMGIGLIAFQRIHQAAAIQDVNPFIERDSSKCILCAKCIRVDHELVVEGAIDYLGRGFSSRPATVDDAPLELSDCTFCGTCVAVCPTGALMEKRRSYGGSTTKAVSTVCPFCGCGCTISLEVKDDRVVRVRPGADDSISRGALCVKGSYGYDFVHSSERLTHPLVRADGDFKEASWQEALGLVASELSRIGEAHGAGSLAVLGSSKCTNEENYVIQRFARSVLGTNNIDNGGRLHSTSGHVGLGWTLGTPGTTGSLDELEQSDVIMVVGANPSESAPAVGYAIKRAVRHGGSRLLLVDPRRTKLTSFAHLWLRPRVGTDLALINGMATVIISEGLLDEEFVTRRTENFDAFRESIDGYTPDYVEEASGIPNEDVRRAAGLFAGASQASIVYGNGIAQHVTGTDSIMALANLAMLTGNAGRSGGGIYALQRDNNGQGACDMGSLPDFLPGYQSVEDAEARHSFEQCWGTQLPAAPGLTSLEMIEQARHGRIRGMYIVGENPALSFPNLTLVREVLSSLEFLVVQDLFLTETAKLANVVLPAASFAEKDGTFTNFEGRVQRIRRAIGPLNGSLTDGEIILRLARAMDRPMPYSSVMQVMDEVEELVPLYQGIGYADAGMEDMYRPEHQDSPLARRRLHSGKFPKAFDRFYSGEVTVPAEPPTDEYPLLLLTGTVLHRSGTGTGSSKSRRLTDFQKEAFVEINRADAAGLGISQGEEVKVSSAQGEVTARAKIANSVAEGMLFMPVSFPQSPVNALFDVSLDPRSKAPSLKACHVRLERNGSDG